MANAVPHTLFQWSLSCLQVILLFLSFMGTLLSYYTLVFRSTLLSSPCVGTIQFLHKRAYIHRPYSVSDLSWYQRQSLAPFWLSSRLLVLRSTVLSPIPSTVPVTPRGKGLCPQSEMESMMCRKVDGIAAGILGLIGKGDNTVAATRSLSIWWRDRAHLLSSHPQFVTWAVSPKGKTLSS